VPLVSGSTVTSSGYGTKETQPPLYSDYIFGNACATTYHDTGNAKNHFKLDHSTGIVGCASGGEAESTASALLGGPSGSASGDVVAPTNVNGSAEADLSDTVVLTAPSGYKKTSVTVTYKDKYKFYITEVNEASAANAEIEMCYGFNGSSDEDCYNRTSNGEATVPVEFKLTVAKSNGGFEFPVAVSVIADAAVESPGGGTPSASLKNGRKLDPDFPYLEVPKGWKCTWASSGSSCEE
jgi:hypothetical protein